MVFATILILSIIGLAVVAGVIIVKKLIHICQPNHVLVFSGKRRRVNNKVVGYRLVQGGRGVQIPLLEKVDLLDLSNMIIDVRVQGAYSRGGIPLNVAAVANVKIASEEPTIGNAIERFLQKPRHEIERVAKETLEGNLRGVLATLTPEEVNQDRVKFAQSLLHEADVDLKRLGLVLDTLKIQHVSDDKNYLESLGRKQSADLQMRSRVAEAANRTIAAERDAQNYQTRSIARVDAEMSMARADADRRVIDATTKKAAMVAEQRAQVTALVARAHAELEVQRARLTQVQLQLEADRIKTAEAERERMIAEARGAAATVVAEGKATAQALRHVARSWHIAGGDARRIFVAQKLTALVGQMLDTVKEMPIDEITIIDAKAEGGGASLAARSRVAATGLGKGLGVDVKGLLGDLATSLSLVRSEDV